LSKDRFSSCYKAPTLTQDKPSLRTHYRKLRRAAVAAVPQNMRALILHRPPAAITALAQPGCIIALYHANTFEAPTLGYAKFFHDLGHTLALPHFASRTSPMQFRLWANPYSDDDLAIGPWGALQPPANATLLAPTLAFIPLIAFTSGGARLGQGGGHYDRYLADNPNTTAVGLAWDCQLAETLPIEPHDQPLTAIITPTRIYGEPK
jgi:5-formyltetrahydrofolate cyclo-ligase